MSSVLLARSSVNLDSKSPNGGPVRKKAKPGAGLPDKKIAEDEFMAAAIGDVEWLKQSLRGSKGQINFDKNGLAPIHLAAIHGRLDCLKYLIDKLKVDVNLPSNTGWRPIHLCISNQTGKRAFQSLLFLLEKGADPSACNDDKITPAHQAASEGHVQCLKALVEVGGNINSRDVRGHLPIDLAKLWGHRKCARILAAESWHQSKEFLAHEMKQLQKIQMQQAIDDIQADEENKADQQFYGDLAFTEWLEKRGLQKSPTGPREKGKEPERKDKQVKTKSSSSIQKVKDPEEDAPKLRTAPKRDSVHKPNSFRPATQPNAPSPILEEQSGSSSPQRRVHVVSRGSQEVRSPYTKFSSESGGGLYESGGGGGHTPSLDQQEEPAAQPVDPYMLLHPSRWNKSTKVPEKDYVSNLPDHYPRDEYTMLPRHAPKRLSRSPTLLHTDPGSKPPSAASAMRMPKLPKEVINAKLDPLKYDRPVVYKCKHIGDVHKKHHPEFDILPKHEAGMHLSSDPTSLLFRNALLVEALPNTPSTVISGVDWGDDIDLVGVSRVLGRMGPKQPFPNIKGPEAKLTA